MSKGATTSILRCNINSKSEEGNSRGILNVGTVAVLDCNISSIANKGNSIGANINSDGVATISNTNIKAYSHLLSGSDQSYEAYSQGISNRGTLTINNCYIMGTHSGVQNKGNMEVNGGTYEGVCCGGFYFAGNGTTSYVQNAKIRECSMPLEYDKTVNSDANAGFYIGDGNNVVVYMNNCDISESSTPIFIRSIAGEKNNILYISNSKINTEKQIKIDSTDNHIYIGKGNNFTAANTTCPEAVYTQLDKVYVK